MNTDDKYIYNINPAYFDAEMLERIRMRDVIEVETRKRERESLALSKRLRSGKYE